MNSLLVKAGALAIVLGSVGGLWLLALLVTLVINLCK